MTTHAELYNTRLCPSVSFAYFRTLNTCSTYCYAFCTLLSYHALRSCHLYPLCLSCELWYLVVHQMISGLLSLIVLDGTVEPVNLCMGL